MLRKLFTAFAFSAIALNANSKLDLQTTVSDALFFSPSIGVQYQLPKNFALELNIIESLTPLWKYTIGSKGAEDSKLTMSSLVPSINFGARWYMNQDRTGIFAYLGVSYDRIVLGKDTSMNFFNLLAGLGYRHSVTQNISISNKIFIQSLLYMTNSKDSAQNSSGPYPVVVGTSNDDNHIVTSMSTNLIGGSELTHRTLLSKLRFELIKLEFSIY